MQQLKMALIGEHISRSRLSRAMEILCAQADIKLDFATIDSAEIANFDFTTQVVALRAQGLTGVTVTHPFKTDADSLTDTRISYPTSMGASNLLRFEDDKMSAFNTDFTGFKSAWAAQFGDQKPGIVAVAGAGGVARALVAGLMDLGATKINIWDQREGSAQALVDQLDPTAKIVRVSQDIPSAIAQADGLVNATPMGMVEYPGTAFEPTDMGTQTWAFDAVYTPLKTQFLTAANTAGLATLSGFELFKHMAVRTFAAYTNIEISPNDVALLDPLAQGL